MLLMDGFDDTLRISLAADPVEVKVGFDLTVLRLRSRGINFVACQAVRAKHSM